MEGVDALMRASSVSGRGTSRVPRGPAKVVRIPTATRLRRKRLQTWSIIAAVLVVGAGFAARFNSPVKLAAAPVLPPDQFGAAEARILDLVNDARRESGLTPLTSSDKLMTAARLHSEDMAAHQYVAHEGGAGDAPADRLVAVGLDYQEITENLFSYGGPDVDSVPSQALATWLASPAPRENLLSPQFRLMAVAIARAIDGSFYVTLDLMR
jgi:uncharacterized protein YkwD